jgi:hypothetical protein
VTVVSVQSGAYVSKDVDTSKVYTFDWDLNSLAAAVTIASSAWAIGPLAPSSTDSGLTFDNAARLTAAQATAALGRTVTLDNRATQVRLIGGTVGQKYEVENTIVTSESPAQTKIGVVRIVVED